MAATSHLLFPRRMHSPKPARRGIAPGGSSLGIRVGTPLPRSLAPAVRSALRQFPVVLVTGARQCGKTTLVGELEPERAYLDLDEDRLRRLAIEDPDGFVADLPDEVAIDEVQRAPALLSAIKVSVDRARRPGRFLLIGSSDLLLLPSVTDSLAGRIAVLELQPLTESEKEKGRGGFLGALLDQDLTARVADNGPPNGGRDAARRILAGGYPDAFRRTADEARRWRRHYLLAIMAKDARDAARLRDASELERLVELLASFTAQPLNVSRLSRDLGLDRETVNRYLAVLERLFLIRRLPSWHHAAARRPARSPKIHLRDTGLAATLAEVTEDDWMARRESFGPLLESFVVQQIAAQAGWTDPDLRLWHYRDRAGVEVDLLLTRRRRIWGVEVKAAGTVRPRDTAGLRTLADRCGNDFAGGFVLHTGPHTHRLPDRRLQAVSLRELWLR